VRAMRQIHDALPYLCADRALGHEWLASQITSWSDLNLGKTAPVVISNKRESFQRRLNPAATGNFAITPRDSSVCWPTSAQFYVLVIGDVGIDAAARLDIQAFEEGFHAGRGRPGCHCR
jgi:hypothetical protein